MVRRAGESYPGGVFTYAYGAAGCPVRAQSVTSTLAYNNTSVSLSAGNAAGQRITKSAQSACESSLILAPGSRAVATSEQLRNHRTRKGREPLRVLCTGAAALAEVYSVYRRTPDTRSK